MSATVKNSSAEKPYVVSADLGLLLSRWANRSGFTAPSSEFLSELRQDFTEKMTSIFPSFELLDEMKLEEGISKLITEFGRPVISLDRVYTREASYLELSRAVDENRESVGMQQRANSKPPAVQFDEISAQFSGSEVVLTDDVIFEGKVIEQVITELNRRNVRVASVFAAVGISEGVTRVQALGTEVHCLHLYDDVVDEVCERDFYPGTPFSGRSLHRSENIGLPYIAPFGLPEQWASIPHTQAKSFSNFCIEQTKRLFSEIERRSSRLVFCSDIPRGVFGLNNRDERFVDALERSLL